MLLVFTFSGVVNVLVETAGETQQTKVLVELLSPFCKKIGREEWSFLYNNMTNLFVKQLHELRKLD